MITGAARGQGRSHAVRLAQEGAQIIAVDVDGLDETVALVEGAGQAVVACEADVRRFDEMRSAIDEGLSAFGHVDTLVANAAVCRFGPTLWETEEQWWRDHIETNLTGVFHTVKAGTPALMKNGAGSIVIISSGSGLAGNARMGAYVASKHGVIGLMRSLALELAPYMVRVNAICPGLVNTPLVHEPEFMRFAFPEDPDAGPEDLAERGRMVHPLPIPWLEASDISDAVLWLASEEARYVTGVSLPVDAGWLESH
jgi:(+)-trans-carveol dehydrogenase